MSARRWRRSTSWRTDRPETAILSEPPATGSIGRARTQGRTLYRALKLQAGVGPAFRQAAHPDGWRRAAPEPDRGGRRNSSPRCAPGCSRATGCWPTARRQLRLPNAPWVSAPRCSSARSTSSTSTWCRRPSCGRSWRRSTAPFSTYRPRPSAAGCRPTASTSTCGRGGAPRLWRRRARRPGSGVGRRPPRAGPLVLPARPEERIETLLQLIASGAAWPALRVTTP